MDSLTLTFIAGAVPFILQHTLLPEGFVERHRALLVVISVTRLIVLTIIVDVLLGQMKAQVR